MLQPNIGGVVSYLSASPGRRKAEARKLADQGDAEYAIETDFWKRMREAIVRDRKTTRDGQALHVAAESAAEKKRASFKAVANAWPAIASRWATTSYCSPSAAVISLGGLNVSVKPLFVEQDAEGRKESVSVWMNRVEPTESAVEAALRLMTLAGPADLATFVDARRGRVWSVSVSDIERIDGWLTRECTRLVEDAA